jgi:hypothetical protein
MRLSRCTVALGLLSLSVSLLGCESSEKPRQAAAPPLQPGQVAVQDTVIGEVTARVQAIDHSTRRVTLVGQQGDEITFTAGPEVQRLNEVRVGDVVAARYRASLLAELRPPTAAELERPIATVRTVARTAPGEAPGGRFGEATRVVTTVEDVDVPNMLVTLRGPLGGQFTVRGRRPDIVQRLQPGDTIVLTYAESVAMALRKVGPR